MRQSNEPPQKPQPPQSQPSAAQQNKKSQGGQNKSKSSSVNFSILPPQELSITRNKTGPLQPPSTNSFIELQNLQFQIKLMCESYCRIIETVLQSDKNMTQESISNIAKELHGKYENVSKQLELLPTYDERTLEDYQREVLKRHKKAVVEFNKALQAAKFWKNQIHAIICNQLSDIQ